MKTTQIFTGHNLHLTDIVAISGVMRESSYRQGGAIRDLSLYLEIHCKHGVVLRHHHQHFSFLGEPTEEEKTRYDQSAQKLQSQRDALVREWEAVLI